MKNRHTYSYIDGQWFNAKEEQGHPYRRTKNWGIEHDYALIGVPSFLSYNEWLAQGSDQRTTLGQIVFRKEMSAQ